eukprot:m.168965 g.168965  ORF g.168965 m.168965 type:complete len:72 (-) comp14762_c0_seq2:1992-2207(-)
MRIITILQAIDIPPPNMRQKTRTPSKLVSTVHTTVMINSDVGVVHIEIIHLGLHHLLSRCTPFKVFIDCQR